MFLFWYGKWLKSKEISVKVVHVKKVIVIIQQEDKSRTEAIKVEEKTQNKRNSGGIMGLVINV